MNGTNEVPLTRTGKDRRAIWAAIAVTIAIGSAILKPWGPAPEELSALGTTAPLGSARTSGTATRGAAASPSERPASSEAAVCRTDTDAWRVTLVERVPARSVRRISLRAVAAGGIVDVHVPWIRVSHTFHALGYCAPESAEVTGLPLVWLIDGPNPARAEFLGQLIPSSFDDPGLFAPPARIPAWPGGRYVIEVPGRRTLLRPDVRETYRFGVVVEDPPRRGPFTVVIEDPAVGG